MHSLVVYNSWHHILAVLGLIKATQTHTSLETSLRYGEARTFLSTEHVCSSTDSETKHQRDL